MNASGNLEKYLFQGADGFPFMQSLLQNPRYSLRALRVSRGSHRRSLAVSGRLRQFTRAALTPHSFLPTASGCKRQLVRGHFVFQLFESAF
jgi:hypothetical protein